jgi:LmbE family N-acetylglucosaminyl deacetylase
MITRSAVVVLHAHPDDEAIFTGATIRALADAGARVVLVAATSGEEGVPQVPLRPGESVRERRIAELERACELLGVARLVLLGYRDSGAHGGPFRRDALASAPVADVARRLGHVVAQEQAQALVHYDRRGIYGHVDHLQVHRAGARVVRGLGISGYEATVDAARLRRGPRHVLQQAAGEHLDAGVHPSRIGLTVDADEPLLLAKLAAMSAHASQIGPEYLAPDGVAEGYRREWFVRRGAPGVIESALDERAGRSAVAVRSAS